MHRRPLFPFAAILGQPRLQTALMIAAVDPLIGGVLIEGPRGTAKSTSARALAELLPDGRFVNLPLGTSEEQLAGSLDLGAALGKGEVVFRPGLLARAHTGVLYVDEVNLLGDALVDLLLDVSASGLNLIERDGISHQHPARFVLVGTMNPEEGELRPQLLDRFGLFVRLDDVIDRTTRQAIVRARLDYDRDPDVFVARHTEVQRCLVERIVIARERLEAIPFTDAAFERVGALCCAAGVAGVRADLVMLRAARAHAALEGDERIRDEDIDAVAELALAHRRGAGAHPAFPPAPFVGSLDGTHGEKAGNEEKAGKGKNGNGADEPPQPPLDRVRTNVPSGQPATTSDGFAGSSQDALRDAGREDGAHDETRQGAESVGGRARSSASGDQGWGELSPEPVPVVALKSVRPLSPKKR